MADLIIHKLNETFVKIETNKGIEIELAEEFSFFAQSYKFNPKFKHGIWDGKIRLYNKQKKTIYKGLVPQIEKFCADRKYSVELKFDNNNLKISLDEIKNFITSLKLPSHIEVREYQLKAILDAIRNKRLTVLSPTGSGKSLIIYIILRYLNVPTLLIVPSTSLVSQMHDDFTAYSINDETWDVKEETSKIMGGYSKEGLNPLIISTWQSLAKVSREWIKNNGIETVLVDECYTASQTVLSSIIEKCEEVPYRFGFTGTLQDTAVHELTLNGLFGPTLQVVETKELIKQEYLSEINIDSCVLSYSNDTRKLVKEMDYKQEIDFIISHNKRNNFIVNLGLSLSGNTLILFNFVEKHGKVLYDKLLNKAGPDKKVFFISGEIDGDTRNEIRKQADLEGKNCIIVASYATFQAGINIINLHNIIFAHPTKAKIRIVQSIGRGLRRAGEKNKCVLYDISDDMRKGSNVNYSYKHMIERLKIYKNQGFPYLIRKIELEK